jgi:hypothetical protein
VILPIFALIEVLKSEVIFSDFKLITLFLFMSSFIYAKIFHYSDNLVIYILLFGGSYAAISYFYKKSVWLK